MKSFLLSLFLSVALFTNLDAQSNTFQKLITELQLVTSDGQNTTVGFWMPSEFWDVTLNLQGQASKSEIDEIVEVVKPFAIFVVLEARVDGVKFEFSSYEDIKRTLSITDHFGNMHKPIEENELNEEIFIVLDVMKPLFKKLLGEFGENYNFYVFSDISESNTRNFDPTSNGLVKLTFGQESFTWKTPLSSFVLEKKCPIDSERFNGNWFFCPIHGEKLQN